MLNTLLGVLVVLLGGEADRMHGWHSNYAAALQEVQRTDRPLFVMFDREESSEARTVSRAPFMSEQVEQALVADYVRLFVNVDTRLGLALADQFGSRETPRIVVVDRSGAWQVYRQSGVHTPEQVLAVLAQYRTAKLEPPAAVEPPRAGRSGGLLRWCGT